MDSLYYVIGFFAVIALAAFLIYRSRVRMDIKGPGGTGMRMDASNDPSPAAKVKDVKSRKGGLNVEVINADGGADVEKAEVEGDIKVSVNKSGNSHPKA